ncbi:tumor necrosis factor receptor superfamily member 1A-like [Xyrichtys novacula]|uniref:Tumor necrosis factor receptor superfamily member 1A-like n=1 Tax=Xyrichtys novacula TaxID=13765 RepID=A0AAV1HIN9_XYRNO|nr:tumor necrosis factor receptor superfamily member 1A-like [Xyrichtys novacula]
MYLVIPLALVFFSTGLSYNDNTGQNRSSCYDICPAGYYRKGDCKNAVKKMRCEKCLGNTYTNEENSLPKCLRCSQCRYYEVQVQRCFDNNDAKCECKKGHYYHGDPTLKDCQKCPKHCIESDKYTDCKKKCQSNSTSTDPLTANTGSATTSSTTSMATKTASTGTISTKIPPEWSLSPWFFLLVVALVTLLVLSWLLLLNRNPRKSPASWPCWGTNKDLELEPNFTENGSHHGSSPTTVTLNIPEETPMMTQSQSPATQEPPTPAHISPLLLGTEHKAANQDEESDQWPAIVLYAIIKEVPLRRWKEFLRLLSMADQQLERVEMEACFGLGLMERQYQMLRLWSQRSSASLRDVFSALYHMDLSGCAQLLQESLEKLQYEAKPKQVVAVSRNDTIDCTIEKT